MFNRILSLFSKDRSGQGVQDTLALQAELQAAQLELRETERTAARLTGELESLRATQRLAVGETENRQVEQLLRASAGPAAQLLTQTYLVKEMQRPVQVADVLNVAGRLISALENAGLQFENRPGETANFDPDHHIALSAEHDLVPGEAVTVRIPGANFRGEVILRAGVEKRGGTQ